MKTSLPRADNKTILKSNAGFDNRVQEKIAWIKQMHIILHVYYYYV